MEGVPLTSQSPVMPADTPQLSAAGRTCWKAAGHAPAGKSGSLSDAEGLFQETRVPSSAGPPHHSAGILHMSVHENCFLYTGSFPVDIPASIDS